MTEQSVCHVSTSFPLYPGHPSGWFVWEQVRALAAQGLRIKVVAPSGSGGKSHEEIEGVDIYRYRYMPRGLETVAYGGGIPANLKTNKGRWLLLPAFFTAGMSAVSKHLQNADLVHAHWSLAGLMALGAVKKVKRPLVVSFHGSDVMGASTAMKKAAAFVAKRAARVLVHSNVMAEQVRAIVDPDKLVVVPHGVDMDRFKQADPGAGETVRMIAVGRLSREKGFDVLLAALAKQKANLNWHLTLFGDGPERAALVLLARESGIFDRVDFVGFAPHDVLLERFAQSHLGVFPSRREGFGVACLEAQASGLPVVATACGGFEEIVVHGETGIVVPVDNPGAFADAVDELLKDSALRKRQGKEARTRVEKNFSSTVVTLKLVELYNDVIS